MTSPLLPSRFHGWTVLTTEPGSLWRVESFLLFTRERPLSASHWLLPATSIAMLALGGLISKSRGACHRNTGMSQQSISDH